MSDEYLQRLAESLAAAPERDRARIPEVCYQVEQVWLTRPELRLTQLLWAASSFPHSPPGAFFNMEDDELVKRLGRLRQG